MAVRITWIGHASVKISGSAATVYIDPWKVRVKDHADIILLTHDHYDHYSEPDIKALMTPSTRVVAPMSTPLVTDRIAAGKSISIRDVTVRAVPAYNMGKAFHPKANGWVGYVIIMDGTTVYHPGDTDRIPEMKGLSVDVALIPVGGTYTMDAREASEVLTDIKAAHAIPIHYGDIVGSRHDAEIVQAGSQATVEILEPGGTLTVE